MPYRSKSILIQSDTEYCLYIHPAEKERAKAIVGHRWDTERNCWLYPLTKLIHDAIITEFGDELIEQSNKHTPETTNTVESIEELVERNKILSEENETLLTKLTDVIKSISTLQTNSQRLNLDNSNLRSQLDELQERYDNLAEEFNELQKIEAVLPSTSRLSEPNLQQLISEIAQRDTQINDLLRKLREYQGKYIRLQKEIEEIRSLHLHDATTNSPMSSYKIIALEATGNDTQYAQLLDKLVIDRNLPIQLAVSVERKLKTMLKIPNADSIQLNELLMRIKDMEVLSVDALDLAHLLRKQRNLIAHSKINEKFYIARALMCLYASALLWPELPK